MSTVQAAYPTLSFDKFVPPDSVSQFGGMGVVLLSRKHLHLKVGSWWVYRQNRIVDCALFCILRVDPVDDPVLYPLCYNINLHYALRSLIPGCQSSKVQQVFF